MKNLTLVLGLFLLFILLPNSAFAASVNGYYRSNGTYVHGYERTTADGNPYNNYSYPGNYNPNTGSITGGSQGTYLNNYYSNSSASNYYPTSSYSYPTTPTCPISSYYNGSSCTCNSGYLVKNGSCVNADSVCWSQTGIMSSYDSVTNSCKCSSGYVIGTSGTCIYQAPVYTNPVYSPPVSTCPLHSYQSFTDSTQCTCDSGYQTNGAKNACVLIPTQTTSVTNIQAQANLQAQVTALLAQIRILQAQIASAHK
jgi:hypothetical protein